MDHPVAVPGPEQRVSTPESLARESDLDLVLGPLVGIERAAVPDPDRAGAVLAGWNVALKLEVLDRVVLGPHREPVVLGVGRDPVRHRPRGERAVVLEPQIPVKPPCVMLVDHEALLAGRPRPGALRLWRGLEAALAAIGLELVVGHVRTLAPANFGDLVRNSEPGSHSSSRHGQADG